MTETTEEELIAVTRETFNWVVGYLRERPYGEVQMIMEELVQNSRVIRVEAPQETPDE